MDFSLLVRQNKVHDDGGGAFILFSDVSDQLIKKRQFKTLVKGKTATCVAPSCFALLTKKTVLCTSADGVPKANPAG